MGTAEDDDVDLDDHLVDDLNFHVDVGAQWIYFRPITSGEQSTTYPLYNPATYNSNALVGTVSFEVKI